MDNSSDVNVRKLAAFLENVDLHQYVTGPTHQNGQTLDLLIARVSHNIVLASSVATTDFISDHCAIICHLQLPKPKPTKRLIRYRMLKRIHHDAFQEDLLQSSLIATPNDELTTFLGQYSTDLSFLLDKHVHLKEHLMLVRPQAPRFNSEISKAKKLHRRYEDMWRHLVSPSTVRCFRLSDS